MLSGSTKQYKAAQAPLDYRVIVAISLLLSLWLILIDPIINRDAILYLRTAEAYLQDGLLASFAVFDRPFLSIVIAQLHLLTGLSLLQCGLILSTLFYAVLSTTFVSIVRLLGGDRRVQIIAAIVILSHPSIAAGRDSIMRDPPFWAFSLLAFRALLLYMRNPLFKYQFQWFISIGIASLFRFEGIFFAVFAPLAVLAAAERGHKLHLCFRLLALPSIALAVLGITTIFIQATLLPGSQLFPDITHYVEKLFNFPQKFTKISTKTGEALLFFKAKEDASIAALAGLAAILVVNLCRAIMWPYVFVLIWGKLQNMDHVIRLQPRSLLRSHLIIGLAYLCLFTLINRFMLERYSHIVTIFIALYLPFILNSALMAQGKPVIKFLASLLLVGMVIDVAGNTNYSKGFIKDASEWLLSNTSEDSSITSNSKYIAYFSGRKTDWRNLGAMSFKAPDLSSKPALWRSSDYIVVQVKTRETEQWTAFMDKNSLTELKVFEGGHHGKISIIEVPVHLKNKGGVKN